MSINSKSIAFALMVLTFCWVALALLPAGRALAADLNVPSGSTVNLSGNVSYDWVGVDGTLVLAAGTKLTCTWLIVGGSGTIKLTGDVTIFVNYHEVYPSGTDAAVLLLGFSQITNDYHIYNHQAQSGADGADGAADSGAAGVAGGNGSDGKDGYSLDLFVDGDMYIENTSYVYLEGETGGDGGKGGTGGTGIDGSCGSPGGPGGAGANGGKGGKGGKGGSLSIVCKGTLTSTSGAKPMWYLTGGNGGSGGNGGYGGQGGGGGICYPGDLSVPECRTCANGGSGGAAGLAGNQGRGGEGGRLYLVANRIENVSAASRIYVNGGQGGQYGGISGRGGRNSAIGYWGYYEDDGTVYCSCAAGTSQMGGDGRGSVPGGDGGQATIQAPCGIELAGALTINADGGLGARGIHAGGLCQGHPSAYGVNGAANTSGLGGQGGFITVSGGHLDNLTLQAKGGQGGQGGFGGNLFVSTGVTCVDPTGAGHGGNGGAGGPGGNGGTISVTGDEIAASVTGTVAGGLGGDGGLGGAAPSPCGTGATGTAGSAGAAGDYTPETGGEAFSAQLSVSPSIAPAGGVVQYAVGVLAKNSETGVVVSLPLSDHTSFVDASAGYSLEGDTVSWNVGGLPSCKLEAFWVRLRLDEGLQGGAVISAQATATRTSGASDNSDEVDVTVKLVIDPVRADTQLGVQTASQTGPDPVHTGTGNYYFNRRLIHLPGVTYPFEFSLTYNSADNATDGPLGHGWNHSYNAFADEDLGANEVTIIWGDGKREHFSPTGGGAYQAKETNTDTILASGSPDGWVATRENGLKYKFNSSGYLTEIEDRSGHTITLNYTGSELTSVTDQAGRTVTFTYDSGKLASVTAPGSIACSFIVDGNGDLTRITDPRGNHWDFAYDGTTHRMQTLTDRRGQAVLALTYDGQGRVASQTNVDGGVTTYAYDANLGKTAVTPPSGNGISHSYDAAFNQTAVTDATGDKATFSYSNKGKRLGATDKMSGSVAFAYDDAGNLTNYTDRLGHGISAVYNSFNLADSTTDPLGRTSNMSYDGSGNMTAVTDPLGGAWALTFNSDGQPLTKTDPNSHTWQMAYNSEGLVQSVTDPLGRAITHGYDAAGRLTSLQYPTTPSSSQTISYDGNGNVTGKTDRRGISTVSTYDANDNVLSRTLDPSGINAATTYQYNNRGLMTRITDPEGGEMTFTYDADGNVKTMTDGDGVTLTYNYDQRNRLTSTVDEAGNTTSYAYDDNGRTTGLTDPLGRTWSFQHDAEGRLTRATDPEGRHADTTYDALGQVLSTTDPMGRTTSYTYDSLGRRTRITYPDSSHLDLQYDPAGNLTRLTDQRGNYWQMEYDELDRLKRQVDPLGGADILTYDVLGNLTGYTDRLGRSVSYTYDLSDRLTSITLPGAVTISYAYDNTGNLTSLTDPAGTTTLTYDRAGRRTSLTDTRGKSLAFTYTPGGRLATLTYPGNKVLTHAYDNSGRLASLTDWNGGVTSYQYDALNRVVRVNLPNATYTEQTYDQSGHLTALTHKQASGAVIVGYALTRDSLGRITVETASGEAAASPAAGNTTFAQNAANRLTSSQTGSQSTSYAYDATGNLTGKTTGTTTTSYTFDILNRLTQVSGGGSVTSYVYDGEHNRIRKTFDGAETNYLRQGNQIFCTYDQSGEVTRYFINGGTLLYSLSPTGDMQVYHGDPRGSVAAVSDASAAVVLTYAYDPFGQVVGGAGSLLNPFQYVGTHGVLRDENGLYFMTARYYDPNLMRFVSEDPSGLGSGPNLYSYADGDPVNHIDPLGWDPVNPVWAATKAQRFVMEATGDARKAAKAYDDAYAAAKKGLDYALTADGVVLNPVVAPPPAAPKKASVALKPRTSSTALESPKPVSASLTIKEARDAKVTWSGRAKGVTDEFLAKVTQLRKQYAKITGRPGCGELVNSPIKPPPIPSIMYNGPIGPNPRINFITVDRFTFFFRKIGIQAENLVVRALGSAGSRVAFVGARGAAVVGTVLMELYFAWEVGWAVGDDARGWTVWDSEAGKWMTLDDWVAKRLNEAYTEDPQVKGYEYYQWIEKVKLQEFSDELQRVWDMK